MNFIRRVVCGFVALGLCLAMTAPSWGATTWTGAGGDGLWSTDANWDNGAPNTTTRIENGDPVLLDTDESVGELWIDSGSVLTITGNLDTGGDTRFGKDFNGTGTVIMKAGSSWNLDDDMKMDEGGNGIFIMEGGTFEAGDYFELSSGGSSLLEISGGSFTVNSEVRIHSGTIRVIGNDATLISFDAIDDEAAGATYEFVPNAAGLITPITSGDTKTDILSVILDDLTGPSTMTLINGGWTDPFNTISVTKDGNPLTLGTEGALNVGEYFLAGDGSSDDLVLSVNVASSNVVPEPSTFVLAALGLLGLGVVARRRKRQQ